MFLNWIKKNQEQALLFFILAVAALLRFYHLGTSSLSNDELSALTRARFDTFGELIEKGIKTDGHPAFVETIIWFIIHHLNDDVFTLRFLFAAAGVASVYFIFLLGKEWFGKWCGLFSAAALSTLFFPLLFSQVARPYSFGLLFTIMASYYWTKILFDENESLSHKIMYALSLSLCMYTHYFSFMQAGIIALTGLFFLDRKKIVSYVLLNIIVAILFIPHLNIFFKQFGYGGIGAWLDKPNSTFFLRFLHYSFNDSAIVITVTLLIALAGLFFSRNKIAVTKFHLLALLWVVVPFLIGYYYSVKVNPVLQFSTLLFTLPFLLVFVFSLVDKLKLNGSALAIILICYLSTLACSTIAQKKYYAVPQFGVFKELAEKTIEYEKKYGEENISKTFTVINPDYIGYYFGKMKPTEKVDLYSSDETATAGKLQQLLDTTTSQYFLYAWTNIWHSYETTELITEKFPVVAQRDTFINSEISLFTRGQQTVEKTTLVSSTDFEKNSWSDEEEKHSNEIFRSGKYSQKINSETEYSVTLTKNIAELQNRSNDWVIAEVWFNTNDTLGNASLVISFDTDKGNLSWKGMPMQEFNSQNGSWHRAIACSKIPSDKNCVMKVYVWNPANGKPASTFFIDDFKVTIKNRNAAFREW